MAAEAPGLKLPASPSVDARNPNPEPSRWRSVLMADIAPFAALRYDHTRLSGDLSAVLAPPYDVLDQREKDALLAQHERNIVGIDLPHIPPKSAGPAEAYEASAKMLAAWQAEGVLVREAQPALYVYHQTFDYEGKHYTRKKFIARLRLQPFEEKVVLPHEKTFGGAKEDRLMLMKATHCNVSPVFGLFTDPEHQVETAFSAATGNAPDIVANMQGVKNEMWIVTDPKVIDTVVGTLADKKVYIADGHHRYGTALTYRDWLAGEMGGLSADHPANYVMMVLGSMNDPGSLIAPYNRALADIDLDTIVAAWQPGTAPADGNDADIRLFEGSTGREVALKFTDRACLRDLQPGEVDPWYDLDAAYLHRHLIDNLLQSKLGSEPKVLYTKDAANTKQTAKEQNGVALLVNATPMAHLRAVSEAGGLMPQKSTYFYPKLATGLTINFLE
jgi:uncharacterized protein (DUF1015 family)